ncbi:MAG TPA: ATP-binding protein [Thermoanaerobaculia bacterium]|nr:ATP-binding protein [Thermoanaerobaculia bacterium]
MTSGGAGLARRTALRVAAVQFFLALFVWGVLGAASARTSWLLEQEQADILRVFFARDLPAVGFLLLVLLPSIRISRIAADGGAPLVARYLAFPRRVAVLDLVTSTALFALAAVRLSLAEALPIECAKIAFFGLVAGVLFAAFSYGFLQGAVRPLVLAAIDEGALRPQAASFPLTPKLVLAFLAVAFVVAGLFGELALYRAERNAERAAGERASETVSDLVEILPARSAGPADWRRFFAEAEPLRRGGTVFVLDAGGGLVGMGPASVPGFDRDLLRDDRWRRALLAAAGRGAFPMRRSRSRLVSLSHPHRDAFVGVMMPPDPVVMSTFVRTALPVAVEVLVISTLLAVAFGRSFARPLRVLERHAREFGKDQSFEAHEIAPTDDEIGVLVQSTASMREEIRAVQARLRDTERRAATAELLAGVAHEVRNPLFGITSAAAALERVLSGDPKIAPHLGLIARESRRLSRMMEEMLVLQRVPPRPVGPLPAAAVLRAAAAEVRARHPGLEVPVEIESAADVLFANADRDRVESVFSNLIENAFAVSGTAHVRCRVRREEGFAVVEVEDDGPGIPSEIRDRIFEPFVSTRPGGTGMGLAICRQIVAEHGGSIAVASEPGRTVFTVRLPAV